MKKKLSQIQWHGNQVDSEGVPVIPEAAPAGLPMEGLNEGELYVHTHSSHPSIWIRNDKGEVVEISGSGGGAGGDTSIFLRKDRNDETKHVLGVGGLKFQQKPIDRFIRYYDKDKPEEVSDADFYSALATDMKIEESLENLDKRYLRKDKEDTAQKHITFEEGITVHDLALMANLKVTDLARIARAIVEVIGSSTFVDGFFGEGWQIWKAIATGDWHFTIDRLTVRKVMTVFELIVQKIRSVGGMVVVSAGNGKVKEVEQVGLEYKFTFEDTNSFVEGDLIRCQVWTGGDIKYYWVEVVRVDGENVYTRVSDHAGVEPSVGDEVVLMGNTINKARQGLVLISAAEDGQPRVDVLDGVHTTNFDGCLKSRLGALDGITDERFPADMQPQGYGLYANNCYLSGVFVLSNGKDVQTQFAIMEGLIRTSMSSVVQQINEKDNYLSNASMTANLMNWECNNDVKVFRTSGGLLHFNGNFYSIKNAVAGIVPNGDKNVLRIKNSFIRQKNANFATHPTFNLVEQTTTDENGEEIGTGVELYRPRMFYVSFRYMVTKRGTLRVYFENEQKKSDFEEYTPLNYTKVLEVGNSFVSTDDMLSGKWNGTGDFYLSFDGDMYLYDIALSDDPLSDMEERWSMQLEITEKKIQANAEHIKQQGEDIEAYRSEFLYTAKQLRTEFTLLVQNEKKDITESYTGLVTQTAQSLTSDYTSKLGNFYGTITEEYNSKIAQTAQSVTTTLTGKIDKVEDNIRTDMASEVQILSNQISSKVSQTDYDRLTGRVTTAESSITQNANNISLSVKKDGVISAINQSAESVTIQANRINLSGAVTYQMFSPTLVEKFETKADWYDLYELEQELNSSVAALNQTISSLQTEVDDKASTISLNNKVNELNDVLSTKLSGSVTTTQNKIVSAVIGGSTLISGGYIHADYIKAEDLEVGALRAVNGNGYVFTLNSNGFAITDSDDVKLSEFYISEYQSKLRMAKGDLEMELTSAGIKFDYLTSTYITASGITLKGSAISNLALGSFGYNDMSPLSDFHEISADTSLPAARSNRGRVVFVKTTKAVTISSEGGSDIKSWSSNSLTNSVSTEGAWSLLFLSNGSYWCGFNCH